MVRVNYSKCAEQIQENQFWVEFASFELQRVRVTGSQLYVISQY